MKKPVVLKVLAALMALGSALPLAAYGAYRWSLWRVAHPAPNSASSIGIIGGADGPTAIFITVRAKMEIYLLLGGVLLAGAIGLFLWAGKIGKKQG